MRVQLALNACSCGVRQLLCPHLLWARLWFEAETGQPFPVSGADWQLFPSPSAGRVSLRESRALHALPPSPASSPLRPAEAAAAASVSAASTLLLLPHVSEADMPGLAQAASRLASAAWDSALRARFGYGLSDSGASSVMRGGLRSQAEIEEETERRRVLVVPAPERAKDMLALALNFGRSVSVTAGGKVPTPLALPLPSAAAYALAVSRAAQERLPAALSSLLERAGGGAGVGGVAAAAASAAHAGAATASAAGGPLAPPITGGLAELLARTSGCHAGARARACIGALGHAHRQRRRRRCRRRRRRRQRRRR